MNDSIHGFFAGIVVGALLLGGILWGYMKWNAHHAVGTHQQVCMMDGPTERCVPGAQVLQWIREGR